VSLNCCNREADELNLIFISGSSQPDKQMNKEEIMNLLKADNSSDKDYLQPNYMNLVDAHKPVFALIADSQQTARKKASQRQTSRPARISEALTRFADGIVIDPQVSKLVAAVAKSRSLPCILCGETGTGKEEIAKLVHKRRVEREGKIPFVAVNCANLDANIAASLLFGHKKGAFTGAEATTEGFIGEAHGGILFLDEIHFLTIENQRRLLRVLNDGSYQKVGETKTSFACFQVIVASTQDLSQMTAAGKFIPDLLARIEGVKITLEPLRERPADIDQLVPLFFAKRNLAVTDHELDLIIQKCKEHCWPGNIRELIQTLHTTATLCLVEDEPFTAAALRVNKSRSIRKEVPQVSPPLEGTPVQSPEMRECLKFFCNFNGHLDLKRALELVESGFIAESIKKHKKFADAIKELDMSRSSFELKAARYGLKGTLLKSVNNQGLS
jgi:DNA-binding NtrC family response regulator